MIEDITVWQSNVNFDISCVCLELVGMDFDVIINSFVRL